MIIDVYSLATEDTRLGKESAHSLAGPCPNSHCRCQTNGFYIKWSGGEWRFACRGCWDASEVLPNGKKRGMGDAISYLRHYRHLSYKQARSMVDGQEGVSYIPEQRPGYQSSDWQVDRREEVKNAIDLLHSADTLALDYARSRGFSDEIIQKSNMGYSLKNGIPRLLIPSINDGQIVAIYGRDLRAGIPTDKRWKDAAGGTKSELYLADALKVRKQFPVVLVEDAFSALSIWQEAGDIVNPVATGGTEGAHLVKWIARLARMPLVLVAFDADEAGDEASRYWLDRLSNARRLRPLLIDANDMLMEGYDISQWIERALPVVSELHEPFVCCVCGVDLENADLNGQYDESGQAFCGEHYDSDNITTLEWDSPVPVSDKEHMIAVAQSIAGQYPSGIQEMHVSRRGEYTSDMRIAELLEQERAYERATWQRIRAARAYVSMPRWLVPDTDEWKEEAARCGLTELRARRNAALQERRRGTAA